MTRAPVSHGPVGTAPMNSGALTCQALLNCLVRAVSILERQAWRRSGYLVIRLARSGPVLRAGLRRASAGPGPRVAAWRLPGHEGHRRPLPGRPDLTGSTP